MMGTLLVWIPRSIWPGKPIDSGDLVPTHMGYAYTNLEMPLWGELFIDGGLVAVAMGFLLYGIITARLERGIEGLDFSRAKLGVLVIATLVGLQIQLVRGDLMSNLLWMLVALTLLWMVSVRQKEGAGQAARGHPGEGAEATPANVSGDLVAG